MPQAEVGVAQVSQLPTASDRFIVCSQVQGSADRQPGPSHLCWRCRRSGKCPGQRHHRAATQRGGFKWLAVAACDEGFIAAASPHQGRSASIQPDHCADLQPGPL